MWPKCLGSAAATAPVLSLTLCLEEEGRKAWGMDDLDLVGVCASAFVCVLCLCVYVQPQLQLPLIVKVMLVFAAWQLRPCAEMYVGT